MLVDVNGIYHWGLGGPRRHLFGPWPLSMGRISGYRSRDGSDRCRFSRIAPVSSFPDLVEINNKNDTSKGNKPIKASFSVIYANLSPHIGRHNRNTPSAPSATRPTPEVVLKYSLSTWLAAGSDQVFRDSPPRGHIASDAAGPTWTEAAQCALLRRSSWWLV